MEIIRMELPSVTGMKTVNAYLVKGDQITLVDAGEGTPESLDVLRKKVNDCGIRVKDIDEILITHAHVDHMGGVGPIAEESGATVVLSEIVEPWARDLEAQWTERSMLIDATMRQLLSPDTYEGALNMYAGMKDLMLKLWYPMPEVALKVYATDASHIKIGGELWEPIYVPGHSYSMHCFYHAASQSLISADMILRITPTVVIERSAEDAMVRDKGILKLIESFKKIEQLDIKKSYPGHYDIIENTDIVIDQQLKRIHQRKEQTLALVKEGENTFLQLFQKLYRGRMDLPAFNMLIGYVDLLEDEGKVRLEMQNDYLHVYAV